MRPIGLRRQGEVPARTALEVCARARRFVSLGAQRIRVFPPRPHRPSRPSSPFATKKSGVHRSPAHRCAKRAGTPDTSYFGATTGVVTTGAGTIAGGVAGGAATGAGCDVTGVTTTPVTSPLTTSFCFVDDVGVGSRCVSARRNRLREAEGMQCPDEEALRGAATSRAASARSGTRLACTTPCASTGTTRTASAGAMPATTGRRVAGVAASLQRAGPVERFDWGLEVIDERGRRWWCCVPSFRRSSVARSEHGIPSRRGSTISGRRRVAAREAKRMAVQGEAARGGWRRLSMDLRLSRCTPPSAMPAADEA